MEGAKSRKNRGIVFVAAVAVAATAVIVAVVIYSGFAVGSTDTASNPFGPGEGPPKIIMTSGDARREGQLIGYAYDSIETISELPDINVSNLTTYVESSDAVTVERGSRVEFQVDGNRPPEASFESLSVTAYTKDGAPAGLLDANDEPPINTYTVNLEEGTYILMAVATWLPEEGGEDISGYVMYGYKVQVTEPA